MRIRCTFQDDPNGEAMPLLIAAVDEYTEEAWGCIPDFYTEDILKAGTDGETRECFLHVRDEMIETLFERRTIPAEMTT